MQASRQIKMMGTVIDIWIESDRAFWHVEQVCRLLETYKNRFSANDDQSELMALNKAAGTAPLSVHPDLFELIALGKAHSLATPSNLNIALGPLIQTWRIGFSDARVPTALEIEQALSLTNPADIILDETAHSVLLSRLGMKIDLGALAKGYIADRVMAYLMEQKVSSALINLGGNVLVHGPNPKRANGLWNIGIQAPKRARGVNVGILPISNASVVTSGIYERHLVVAGKDYHHIFDRKTGYPIETALASLTIVAKQSVDCEIWTTRLFGLPLDQILQTIETTPVIEGILITKDNRLILSSGLEKDFYPLQTLDL